MTTRITRPVGEAIASRDRVSPCLLLVAFCAAALLLSACGDDGAGTEAADADEASTQDESPNDGNGDEAGGVEEDDAEEAEESASATGPTVPPNMPQGIPVPDEHVVLRADSLTGSDADVNLGEHVATNIAIGGTVEDQRAFYETELRAAYGDVEVEDGMDGEALRFQGEWFENGRVFVTENDGGLDGGGLDTSHLPVMLTVQVWERADE